MKLADYVVTEAGFGADLGAEKFLDIKCRMAGLKPDAVVIVATIRALKYNGNVKKEDLNQENLEALKQGLPNLLKHVENITKKYGIPAVVAINQFPTDTEKELALVQGECNRLGVNAVLSEVWAKGSEGGLELAKEVVSITKEGGNNFKPIYDLDMGLKDKITTIAREIYGADGVEFTPAAVREINTLEELGFKNVPICIAKTQYSLTDNPKLLGRPTGFKINVRNVRISAGAGFAVVLTGAIMTMPGLPKRPAAENIDVERDGKITGLF